MSLSDFEAAYRIRDRQRDSITQGQKFTYGRRFAQLVQKPQNNDLTFYQKRLRLIDHIPLASSILMVGAGFGFLEEVARDYGYGNVTSLDNNAYINEHLVAEADPSVVSGFLNVDILGDVSALGVFDYVVSEDLLGAIAYKDRLAFYNNCDVLSSQVIHLVAASTKYNELFENKTLATWFAEYPTHKFVDLLTSQSIG